MRSNYQGKMKSLILGMTTLLATQYSMADSTWKPAAALMTLDQDECILKKVSSDRGSVIKVDYAVPAPKFELNFEQSYRGENTELCKLGNAWMYGEPGEPFLPYITARIILPYGCTVKTIHAIPTDCRQVDGRHLLTYGETPIPISSEVVERTAAKDAVYESAEIYPQKTAELACINNRCGVSIATIYVYPVQYVPKYQSVTYWKSFSLEIETELQQSPGSNDLRIRLDRFEGNGLTEENPETLNTYPDKVIPDDPNSRESAESYSLLIITSKAIINATTSPSLKDFVEHKTKMGQTVKVEAIEDILKSYSDREDTDKLRKCLKDAYNKWNVKYVLLGGKPKIIPLKTVNCSNGGHSDNLPTDLPYQCLSKDSWNNDYEGSVFIGRISAQDEKEFSNQIYKSMAYETMPTSDPYMKSEVGASEKLDAQTQAKPSIDAIQRTYSKDWSCGIFSEADGTWKSKEGIFEVTNINKYSVIDHFGHCNTNILMKVKSTRDAWQKSCPLKNTKFFFVKSQGCIPGAFDRDCAAEHWTVVSRTGAWGAVLNSRYGFYNPGNATGGSSHQVHQAFADAMWRKNLKTVSECNEYSHRTNTRNRWDILESNYFGDPTVGIGKVAAK